MEKGSGSGSGSKLIFKEFLKGSGFYETKFTQCPCFEGGSCVWLPKIIVKEDELLPLGITKEDMERFRILLCFEVASSSFGDDYYWTPNFLDLFLCPTLHDQVTALRLDKSSVAEPTPCRPPWMKPWPPPGMKLPEENNPAPKNKMVSRELNMTVEDTKKYHHFRYAEIALDHYNQKHSTSYKLVEAINSRGFFYGSPGWWFHCVFRAAIDTSSAGELFFAEIHALELREVNVEATCILNDTKTTYDDCVYCQGMRIPHPVNRFSQGRRNREPKQLS